MPSPAVATPPAVSQPTSAGVRVFRYIRWSTYLTALITLILVLHKTAPPRVQVSPQAAARAEEKVERVEESASRGEPATLRLDETELNSYLASHLDLKTSGSLPPANNPSTASADTIRPVPTSALPSNSADSASDTDIEQARSSVRDVEVQMLGDQVHAYVVFDVHGKDLTMELVGRLGSSDGFLRFEPVSGRVGSLPIPQSTLRGAVERLMNSPQNKEKLRLPPGIREMHIENGELVATYH
jgi:hypothetical protein